MVSPHGIQLAAHLISFYHGDLCSKVCECLLRRGTLTLPQLIRFTELSRENVMNCLRVLIHQNFVQAFAIQQEGGFDEPPKILTQYMAIFDNVMHKLRAAKFMQIVSVELGEDCLGIFQGLIEHGRLSLDQIIDRNKEIAQKNGGCFDVNSVHESFNRLLKARFIERCPEPEPFLAPPSEEAPKKQRGKSAKIAQESIEKRALAAAAPMESMRFLIEMDGVSGENKEESAKSVSTKKRKHDVLMSDEDIVDSNRKTEVLWRVNFEELVCRLRHKACISYVKTRINDEASIVLSAILDLSRRSENQPKAERTAHLSINAIYDEVIKKEGGLGMDFERVRTSLDQLGCQPLDTEESYSFDIKGTIQMAQSDEVESMVLKRYGREAYRIFRLLSKDGSFLESDKIADSTFVEKKDAIKILHKLWKDDYVQIEKVQVAGGAGAGARQSCLLMCKVNHQRLKHQFLDELYHAALNLRLRFAHERDQAREVLQLPRERLVGDLEKKYIHSGKVRVILESSLMNLDVAIMLFHDF